MEDLGSHPPSVEELYGELRRLARRKLASPGQHSLQATELVHEVYLRFAQRPVDDSSLERNLLERAAQAMRDVLVERARARLAKKRGGDRERVGLSDHEPSSPLEPHQVLAVDELLDELGRQDPRKARLLCLRYFGGLSEIEAAAVLELSVRTIERDWRFVKAWIGTRLAGGDVQDDGTP